MKEDGIRRVYLETYLSDKQLGDISYGIRTESVSSWECFIMKQIHPGNGTH